MTQSIKIEIIVLTEPNPSRTLTASELDDHLNFTGIDENKELFPISGKNNNSNINKINSKASNDLLINNFSKSNSNKNNVFGKVDNILPIINSIKKIIVNSQHIYIIPNSTSLMNLVNLNNFFLGISSKNSMNSNNADRNIHTNNINFNNNKILTKTKYNCCSRHNYIISLFLTASCMTQSRLFIQAWELFNKMQTLLLRSEEEHSLVIYYLIFLQNFNFRNEMNLKNPNKQNNKNSIVAKIEVIKSACMFEHGHTQPFLESLLNAINIFFFGDYTNLKHGINWSKINYYNWDKFHVQNFLSKHGKKLVELLLFCLNDKCEILVISSLKIIEYIIDYNPSIITVFFPKIIKSLLRMIYPTCKINANIDPKKSLSIDNIEYQDFYNFLAKNKEYEDFIQIFTTKGIYFSKEILLKFLTVNFDIFDKIDNDANCNHDQNTGRINNSCRNTQNPKSASINNYETKYSLSSIVIKQVNYTLDTLINNIDNLCFSEVNTILIKSNRLLIEILKYDLDSITMINIVKLVKKIYENVNSINCELNKSYNQGAIINKSDKNFVELISAILTISLNPKIILKDISEINSSCNISVNNSKKCSNSNSNQNKNNLSIGNSNISYCNNNHSKFPCGSEKLKYISGNLRNKNNNNYDMFFNCLKYFELFDNSERSSTFVFVLEKLMEILFLGQNQNIHLENLNWIKVNLEILTQYIKKNIDSFISQTFSYCNNEYKKSNCNKTNNINSKMTHINSINNSNQKSSSSGVANNNLNLFCIFYLYVNLHLLKILFLDREEMKLNAVYKIKFKLNIDMMKPLLGYLNVLIEIEEICLKVRDCFFIFELVMEILLDLKKKFSAYYEINFNKVFIPQLQMLKIRLLEYGIFKENTLFINKVLPFIDLQNKSPEEKITSISALKDIFILILDNFSNFYDEEIFIVYNQFLEKLGDDLDQELITQIVKSIVFKYNYKGNSFKSSTKKLFELFVKYINYFSFFKSEIIESTKSLFFTSLINDSIQVNNFFNQNISHSNKSPKGNNEQVYEYFEKLEFYKKFVEFIKENHKNFDKQQMKIVSQLFYISENSQDFFTIIKNSYNETVIINFFI